jgi:hypothetical protein
VPHPISLIQTDLYSFLSSVKDKAPEPFVIALTPIVSLVLFQVLALITLYVVIRVQDLIARLQFHTSDGSFSPDEY